MRQARLCITVRYNESVVVCAQVVGWNASEVCEEKGDINEAGLNMSVVRLGK